MRRFWSDKTGRRTEPDRITGVRSLFYDQKGQAVVELALMMTFLAMILLGMVFVGAFSSANVKAVEKLRFDMRVSMFQNAAGPFRKNAVGEVVVVDVPGRMRQVFNTPFLVRAHRIEFYEGSYAGRGNSFYRKRYTYRNTELAD